MSRKGSFSRPRLPVRLSQQARFPCQNKGGPRSHKGRVGYNIGKGNQTLAKAERPHASTATESGRNQEPDNPVAGDVSACSRAPAKATLVR